MSLPPSTLQVKRKRNAEPVDGLHLHETKKRHLGGGSGYVYTRQPSLNDVNAALPTSNPMKHSNSAPLPLSNLGTQTEISHGQYGGYSGTSTPGDASPPLPTGAATPIHSKIAQHPRRFYISRSSSPSSAVPSPSRKRTATFLIAERKAVRSKLSDDADTPATLSVPPSPQQARPRKKPGLAKYSTSSTPSTKPRPDLPNPIRSFSGMPYSDELAAQMQAYTLQEIGKSIAASEAERPVPREAVSTRLHPTAPSKFKPKKPALRYAERHPQEKNADHHMDIDGNEMEWEEEVGDESDYVIDTYIRMPVESLESASAPTNFGLLVLDSQPDIDEFYRGEVESDDEEEDEEEDENAEDHYTADYPEDEVASDDEYGRNAYHYSKDIDEFEEDAFSDDESTKFPWAKKPWMNRTDGLGGEDDDEDDGNGIKENDS